MITLILWSVLFELPVCLGWIVVLLLFAHVNFIVRRNLHGSFITLKCRLFIRQVNGFNRASRLYHSIVHLIMVPIWIEITTNCTNSRRFKTAFWLEITYSLTFALVAVGCEFRPISVLVLGRCAVGISIRCVAGSRSGSDSACVFGLLGIVVVTAFRC